MSATRSGCITLPIWELRDRIMSIATPGAPIVPAILECVHFKWTRATPSQWNYLCEGYGYTSPPLDGEGPGVG